MWQYRGCTHTLVTSDFKPLRLHCDFETEEGALGLPGPLPRSRALGALCAERSFFTSDIMELRVPQVTCLFRCFSRARNTYKCFAFFARYLATYNPPFLIMPFCATYAYFTSARMISAQPDMFWRTNPTKTTQNRCG